MLRGTCVIVPTFKLFILIFLFPYNRAVEELTILLNKRSAEDDDTKIKGAVKKRRSQVESAESELK